MIAAFEHLLVLLGAIQRTKKTLFQGSPVFSRRSVGVIDGLGDFSLLICTENQVLEGPTGVFFWHHLFFRGVRGRLGEYGANRVLSGYPDGYRSPPLARRYPYEHSFAPTVASAKH